MNYTLVLIWLCSLAAGCVLVITNHPWFALFVFLMSFVLSGVLSGRDAVVKRERQAAEEPKAPTTTNTVVINRPQGIM